MTEELAILNNDGLNLSIQHLDSTKLKLFGFKQENHFINSSASFKIACVQVNYYDLDDTVNTLNEFKKLGHVVVFTVEMTQQILDRIVLPFDLQNFSFVANCFFNNIELKNAKFYPNPSWITSTSFRYLTDLKEVIRTKIRPFTAKPFYFDVLYGKLKEHRSFVKNYIQGSGFEKHFLQSKMFSQLDNRINNVDDFNFDEGLFWEDEVIPSKTSNYYCSYFGADMLSPTVIPCKVYDQSAYSIVCESNYSNDFSFFTEKIAKPIIACRLFIVISGQYYLKNLRRFGFKTFDGIIDESYDLIEDNNLRWTIAMEQAIKLCSMDQQEILDKCVPILLHNYYMLKTLPNNDIGWIVEEAAIKNKFYRE